MTGAPADRDRDIARELRLRNPPAPVVRLSRRAVALTAGAAAIGVAGVIAWSLADRPGKAPADAPAPIAVGEARPPEQLAALPKDYAGLPPGVPRLGPPLPGDLGRAMLSAGVGSPDAGPQATTSSPPGSQAAVEREQARASRLFAATAQPSPAAAQAPAEGGPRSSRIPPPQAEANGADLEGAGHEGPASARAAKRTAVHLLPSGTTIRAALITGIRSDLPGPVTAQVTEDVFDGVTGQILLIPRGSRLVGAYDSNVAFGQDRAFLAWSQLVLPDGRAVELDKAPATDGAGYAGLRDRVDRHWRELIGASLVSLGMAAAGEVGRSSDEAELLRALRLGVADTAAQAGERVIGRSLTVQPTLTVRPGFPVRVLLTQAVSLPPWIVP